MRDAHSLRPSGHVTEQAAGPEREHQTRNPRQGIPQQLKTDEQIKGAKRGSQTNAPLVRVCHANTKWATPLKTSGHPTNIVTASPAAAGINMELCSDHSSDLEEQLRQCDVKSISR
jgi:hypothetical protein